MILIIVLLIELVVMCEVVEMFVFIECVVGELGEYKVVEWIVECLCMVGVQDVCIEEEQYFDGYLRLYFKLLVIGVVVGVVGLFSRCLCIFVVLVGVGVGLVIVDDCVNGLCIVCK